MDFTWVSVPSVEADTIPVQDNYGDHITDPNKNPFDILPKEVEQKVEYDPESGNYIIFEKIGDEYYRTPTYLTFEEYLDYRKRQQERNYFSQMAGLSTGKKQKLNLIDPMNKVDIGTSLVDRLFGGTEVNIQPQGNVDITLGFDYQRTENTSSFVVQQTQAGLDFDMVIRMNVDGNIGEKLNLGFNYDTQSTFDFDRKIKLEYDSEAFSEDDIIKKIEAGNVSLPLRGNLIQGAQSLFGLKTELQFGHLRLTAIASQQQSRQNNLQIQSGNETTELDPIFPDQYDENRHFFLSHFNRRTYEKNLRQIPFIATSYRINRLEVWISDDRSDYQRNSRQVCAVSDLAEPNDSLFTSMDPRWRPTINPATDPIFYTSKGVPLPDNRVNPLYETINDDANAEIYDIDKTASVLNEQFGMVQTEDFEVFQGRLLSSSEYTYHPELGTISLNIRLRPNQVLGVSYEYFYTENCDEIYTVGQLSDGQTTNFRADEMEEVEPPKITFVKLLKTSNQRPNTPSWDLMMKNVYSLRTSNLSQEDFEFDIFWQDDRDGTLKKFIDQPGVRNVPLLQLFGLDRLNKFQDPQPDGLFDYVPGITVIERNGTVVFPKLEPFGNVLKDELIRAGVEESLADTLTFKELYTNTVTSARNDFLRKNKFTILARVKNAVNGDIQLGPFVPQGSVRVTAGGRQLVEGSDYEIDYSIGRLRIINEAYLQEGVPINVSFEDNAVFSLQQKNMLGLRAEYDFSEKLSIGATYLRLFERPFTQKVNIGDDPINNRVFGLDLAYSTEAPGITSLVDRLPFYSTKEKSSINFTGEVAALLPGTSSAINSPDEDNEAVLNIDDFEGAVSGFLLGTSQNNTWTFASTPPPGPTTAGFVEATRRDDLSYGYNRAKLAWYQLERGNRNAADRTNPYTRQITQQELFQRDVPTGDNTLYTFDLSYWPEERGPYNFDPPEGSDVSSGLRFDPVDGKVKLKDPESRWAGIMRYFNNPDFEAANYEFIEFWMLNPYGDRPDPSENPEIDETGRIIFHLGNVSEDILKDGRQFYENSLNIDSSLNVNPPETNWGIVPFNVPVVDGFDFQRGGSQDVGLDGLTSLEEESFHAPYLAAITSSGDVPLLPEIQQDPSGDDFVYFDDPRFDVNTGILERYKNFNNPEGNAPLSRQEQNNTNGVVQRRGNPRPEKEDLNNNRSLETGETFYEFVLELNNNGLGELDMEASTFIKESREVTDQATGNRETWYRVQIPIQNDDAASNGIEGYRSIQFMRMYMTGFSKPKTFRLAEFELVRNQWFDTELCRRVGRDQSDVERMEFNVDERGIEENSAKQPFGYKSPAGIQQERIFNTFANLRQDENSLSMNFTNMNKLCEARIHKLINLDLTFYEKLELFAHLEGMQGMDTLEYGDLSLFIRIGKDFEQNYYEYEIPLEPSSLRDTSNNNVWPEENKISLDMKLLTDLKLQRAEANGAFNKPWPRPIDTMLVKEPVARILGNPSLGFIKMIQIGVRNVSVQDEEISGEVWVNELRAKGLKDGGGIAAQARMQVKLADLGELNLSGTYESVGWGGLDQRVQERRRDQVTTWDAATNLALDKFFPESWGVQLPFYGQISRNVSTPKFDPFQLDLTVDEAQELEPDVDVKERAQTTTTVKAFNFTNVKVGGGKGARKPWSPSNVSVTYAFSETKKTDPIIEEDNIREHTTSIDYQYSRRGKYIQPLKFIKAKSLKLFSDFGFNLLPSSLTFSTSLNRQLGFRTFRLPESPVFRFDDKRFSWERRYGLKWDITKNLKMNYDARTSSIIDELRQTGIADDPDLRNWVDENGNDRTQEVRSNPGAVTDYWQDNLLRLGRNQGYTHNLNANYTVPFKNIPMMDWVNVKADYKASYGWDAASLITIDDAGNGPGNVIRNSQDRSINANFAFDKLYSKSSYLKAIEKGPKKSRRRKKSRRNRVATKDGGKNLSAKDGEEGLQEAQEEGARRKKKEREGPTVVERVLIRPLMMLRTAKFTYKENLSSLIPNLNFQPQLLGLQEGFQAPGLAYAFGIQPNIDADDPNNFLRSAANEGWVNPSRVLNNEINLDERHEVDLKFILEPFNDFKIDLNFNKRYSKQHREVFKNKAIGAGDPNFIQTAKYDMGSFEATYIGLNTLFMDANDVYQNFLGNRVTVSRIIGDPNTSHQNEDFVNFTEGYGPNNPDVAVPAFLAAYENRSVDQATSNDGIESVISNRTYIPRPNWSLTYDGLNKLGFFKEFLSSFSLKHGYRSTIRVNNFNTTARFVEGENTLNPDNGNFYSRILIPSISIQEQFSPLLGISMKTKNDMNIDFEYSKSRSLDLRLTAEELGEELSTEISFGFGYTIKNFQGFGGGKSKKRKKRQQEKDSKDKANNRRGRVNNNRGRNLTINMDFAYRDDVSSIYQLNTGGESLPVRGTTTLSLNPNIEYVLNDNLTLRFFADYSRTEPRTTRAFPITTFASGITMRFTLN